MESIQSSLKLSEDFITKDEGFVSKVFFLKSSEKAELLNLFQYVIFCIVPIILSLKIMKRVIPEERDDKASIEILFECIVQIILVFVIFFFIHRLVVYFPTYSSTPYPDVQFISVVLPTLFILFTMQTKLGAKLNILYSRTLSMMGFSDDISTNKSEQAAAKKQEIALNQVPNKQRINNVAHLDSRQYAPPASMSSHPYGGMETANPSAGMMQQPNQTVNMPNTQTANNYNQFPSEPMAANDFSPMGGSSFY